MTAYSQHTINCNGSLLELNPPIIMGILNATPDSFYDGGEFETIELAEQQVGKMLEAGAKIIDIGGYSSRPGAEDVSIDIELGRTIPLIKHLTRAYPNICISIDTFRSKVAREAVKSGAAIINDISAGDDDPNMLQLVKELEVPYILMHKQGRSKIMQNNPTYTNVVNEVFNYLDSKIKECRALGIKDIIADPGLGFGKSVDHNFQIIKHLSRFKMLDVPLLIGASRKSMISKVLLKDNHDYLNGTTVLNTIALLNGASILRVHDVSEAMECITLIGRLNGVD
jgi:dihydropteroate synthase